jgi:hypothetical protein
MGDQQTKSLSTSSSSSSSGDGTEKSSRKVKEVSVIKEMTIKVYRESSSSEGGGKRREKSTAIRQKKKRTTEERDGVIGEKREELHSKTVQDGKGTDSWTVKREGDQWHLKQGVGEWHTVTPSEAQSKIEELNIESISDDAASDISVISG